jgi:hypothetical protein
MKYSAVAVSAIITMALPLNALAAVPHAAPSAAKAKPAASAPTGKTVNGWFIHQHMEYNGDVKIYAAPTASKVVTRTLTVYLNPKDDQGVLVNASSHTQTTLDKRAWTDSGMVSGKLVKDVDDAVIKQFKLKKAPPRIIAGHKCVQHWAAAFLSNKDFWFWWEYWTPVDIKLPSEISNQWRAMMHLPAGDTIPFEATRHFHINSPKHKPLEFLKTVTAKQMAIPIEEVTVPKGLRKVGDEIDAVLGSDEKADEMDKIFDQPTKKH